LGEITIRQGQAAITTMTAINRLKRVPMISAGLIPTSRHCDNLAPFRLARNVATALVEKERDQPRYMDHDRSVFEVQPDQRSGSDAAINDEGQEGGKDSCDDQSFDAKTVIKDRHGSLMVVQVAALVQSLVKRGNR
jgi:hypothetical protein